MFLNVFESTVKAMPGLLRGIKVTERLKFGEAQPHITNDSETIPNLLKFL